MLASLTLGGYDQSRFNPDNQNSFDFASQDTKLLTVGVQAITAINTLSGVVSLLPNAVFSVLDSTLPYIWLPKSSCDVFETALGLTYDPKTKLYLVNDTVHTKLQNLKPTFTFKLGADLVGGKSTNIQLPYAAFDLQAGYPFYNDSTNYFPIKRAANDTQYVIGRSFFQEA